MFKILGIVAVICIIIAVAFMVTQPSVESDLYGTWRTKEVEDLKEEIIMLSFLSDNSGTYTSNNYGTHDYKWSITNYENSPDGSVKLLYFTPPIIIRGTQVSKVRFDTDSLKKDELIINPLDVNLSIYSLKKWS